MPPPNRSSSAATPSGIRGWRLRRAERRLRDEAWRVEQWGFEGVYPSEIDKSRERFRRLIRRVHRLGGDPNKAIQPHGYPSLHRGGAEGLGFAVCWRL